VRNFLDENWGETWEQGAGKKKKMGREERVEKNKKQKRKMRSDDREISKKEKKKN
jgi:hypothetical protein